MLGSIALTVAKDLILPEVIKALREPNVPVADQDVDRVADAVATKIAPVAVNKANAEPWYQSRVTIGAIVSIGAGLSGLLLGRTVAPADQLLLVDTISVAGIVVGNLVTLYGRWAAKKPLG